MTEEASIGSGLATPTAGRGDLDASRRARSTPPWLRALGYWACVYKRGWRGSISISFFYPVLYLAAMGYGLGSLVARHVHSVDHVRYLVFIAPALLAATAMQLATNEATFPVMGAIKWAKTYYAMVATPLRVVDVLLGHFAWIALRLTMVSAIYLLIMTAFGVAQSPLLALALPAAVLTGLAFATPVAAFAITQETEAAFSTLFRLVFVPLFLFSGTFFPIGQLPEALQVIAWTTPLSHGVALCRDCALGHLGPFDLGHLAYLSLLVLGGALVAHHTYRRRLVT